MTAEQWIDYQLEKYITISLKSGYDHFIPRYNSFETLGYDFMLDTDLNLWLIECNRSPDLSYTTKTTTKLVDRYFKDFVGL